MRRPRLLSRTENGALAPAGRGAGAAGGVRGKLWYNRLHGGKRCWLFAQSIVRANLNGSIAPPAGAEGMVAVVFLEAGAATDEEKQEAEALAQSPAFHRLVERGLGYVVAEETRPIQALLDELPD